MFITFMYQRDTCRKLTEDKDVIVYVNLLSSITTELWI